MVNGFSNECLERMIEKFEVCCEDADELRRRLYFVSSVDEGTFRHFYEIVQGKRGYEFKRDCLGDVGKRDLLCYDDALRYVSSLVGNVDASIVVARVDCRREKGDFFYEVRKLDTLIRRVRDGKGL